MHSVTVRSCLSCGVDLPPRSSGPGRPALYCSTGCRKQAELEIRRLEKHIDHAEQEIQWWQRAGMGQEFAPADCVDVPGQLAWWLDERERLRARQRELLAAPEGEE